MRRRWGRHIGQPRSHHCGHPAPPSHCTASRLLARPGRAGLLAEAAALLCGGLRAASPRSDDRFRSRQAPPCACTRVRQSVVVWRRRPAAAAAPAAPAWRLQPPARGGAPATPQMGRRDARPRSRWCCWCWAESARRAVAGQRRGAGGVASPSAAASPSGAAVRRRGGGLLYVPQSWARRGWPRLARLGIVGVRRARRTRLARAPRCSARCTRRSRASWWSCWPAGAHGRAAAGRGAGSQPTSAREQRGTARRRACRLS